MFKIVSLVFLYAALLAPSFAQNSQVTTNAQNILLAGEVQWEYLLVNVTQSSTEFNQGVGQVIENVEITNKKIIEDKYFAINKDYFAFDGLSESFNAQAALDFLGKSGWELVAVISGGDIPDYARFVFKRKYNAERSRREAEQRKSEQNRAVGKATSQTAIEKVEFVDLDRAEAIALQKTAETKAIARLEQALRDLKGIPISIVRIKAYSQRNAQPQAQAEIILDGTQALLKGNQYRTSQAQNYLQQTATEIFSKIGLRQVSDYYKTFEQGAAYFISDTVAPRVQIKILVNVNLQNQSQTVAIGMIRGNWADVTANK